MKSGLKNVGIMFLMTDAQVANEHFLVLINDMLASGEIPDLFPDDEVENIIAGVRNEVKGSGQLDTRDNCWKFFIERVRRQLKVGIVSVLSQVRHGVKLTASSRCPGGALLLPRGLGPPRARAQVPVHHQLHRHQLVPRVAAGGAHVRVQALLGGTAALTGEQRKVTAEALST